MLYKIGTVKQLEAIRERLPPQVYRAAHKIALILDREYGAGRDIDRDDGGFILIAETVEDVVRSQRRYVDMVRAVPEEVNILQAERHYINALYLSNNEFGITVMLPLELAPECLQKEAMNNVGI